VLQLHQPEVTIRELRIRISHVLYGNIAEYNSNIDYVAVTSPWGGSIVRVVCHLRLGFDTVYLNAKFEDSTSAVLEILWVPTKI